MTAKEILELLMPVARERHPDALLVPELGFNHGRGRIDLAAITPFGIHAYEIKAGTDSIKTLCEQMDYYRSICVSATPVLDDVFRKRDKTSVNRSRYYFHETVWATDNGLERADRSPRSFDLICPMALLSVLWKRELAQLVKGHVERGASAENMRAVAVEILSLEQMHEAIYQLTTTREGWPETRGINSGNAKPGKLTK